MQLETSGTQTVYRPRANRLETRKATSSLSLDGAISRRRVSREPKKSTRTLARWHEQRIGPPRIKIGKQPLYDEEGPGWLAEYKSKPVKTGHRR